MLVRAKVKFNRLEKYKGYSNLSKQDDILYSVIFNPVTATNNPNDENSQFFASTPSGEIKFNGLNKEVAESFVFGKEYYVDFTPAD